ncbi:MAG: glycosyltransferase family A protein [Candidatus Korobacteraceae bacterium]
MKPILCSVLICTFDRAILLQHTLESLCSQMLGPGNFEVIVVDDGSQDWTPEMVRSFESRLNLRYAYQRNSGLASARNHALFLSQGRIVLFLDDDDIAGPELLSEHLETHGAYPQDNFAVLGYTKLAPEIAADPVMHFTTEIGKFLFSYPDIQDGQALGFAHFWGGRSSCKRRFLLQHGVFNAIFRFGCEDIELAYRLSKYDLRVIYNSRAQTSMVRAFSFDQFCDRLIRQGRSNFVFSQLHPDPQVQAWTEVNDLAKWEVIEPVYGTLRKSGREVDAVVRLKEKLHLPANEDRRLLYECYWTAFRASKIKGMSEAAIEAGYCKPPSALVS